MTNYQRSDIDGKYDANYDLHPQYQHRSQYFVSRVLVLLPIKLVSHQTFLRLASEYSRAMGIP